MDAVLGRHGGESLDLDELIAALGEATLAVIGIPFDENSSFLRGPAEAPAAIREALHSAAGNLCTEGGLDLAADPRWRDLGDLELSGGDEALEEIEAAASRILAHGASVMALGGDHSITYPMLRACAAAQSGLTLLHLDAHPDLYDRFEGSRVSHASPFARIMEEGLAVRLVQVGIRAATPHQREQAERFGAEWVEMRDWTPRSAPALELEAPLYLSLDLDVLDPGFAPGVSHPEPGGLSTRDLLGIVQGLEGAIVAADLVELNPLRDPSGLTARVAAKLMKEIVARMLDRNAPPPADA